MPDTIAATAVLFFVASRDSKFEISPTQKIVVSQHYAPDSNTTSGIITAVANHLVTEAPVLVLSGAPGSASGKEAPAEKPRSI